MVLLCSPFLPLLLLFFFGKLPGGKYGGVCHVYAEKELQSLVAEVASHYPVHALVECFEGMVLDEGNPINPDVVALRMLLGLCERIFSAISFNGSCA